MEDQARALDTPGGQASPGQTAGDTAFSRRSAALIAYLALEGPTARSRLAGLLWPDSLEATARNNLRQALRRLRQLGQGPLLSGADPLRLIDPPEVDAALDLLCPHDYDDLPDFDDWRLAALERRRAARVVALRSEVRTLEAAGELWAALDLTGVWLDLDPVSEDAHRHRIRLHHLLGDRAGALAAYHGCQTTLHRELGLGPAPETVALACEVERGVLPAPARRMLPLAVQRPPRLIGREAVWETMERAWAERKGVVVSGEPGIGKTRLLRDFAVAHGQQVVLHGRPGDWLVPYSTHARNGAALLREFPDLQLPGWVRREFARLVPSLGDAPPPIASDADRLRFYQAVAEVMRLAVAAGLAVLAFDDLQFMDTASVTLGEYVLAAYLGDEGRRLQVVYAYRTGELSAELEAHIDTQVAAGLVVRVELLPFSVQEILELLDSLGLPAVSAKAADIALASRGNAGAALDRVRQLLG